MSAVEMFRKKTVRFKLGSIIAGLIFMMVVILGSFLYTYNSMDMSIIDLAGRQRMLLQKYAKEFFSVNVVPDQVRNAAIKSARDISMQITADRAKYTNAITKAKKEVKGFKAEREWAGVNGGVPLPATFVQEVSDEVNRQGTYRYDLLSKWNINRDKGLKTDFERDAFDAMQKDASKPFYKFEEHGGKFALRYATADVASAQGCVNCHNTLPGSLKTDYKLGDIMGILVVTVPLTEDIALGKTMFSGGAGSSDGDKSYEQTAKVFEKTLNGLMYGGEVPLDLTMTKFKTLPPARNANILASLKEVEKLWQSTIKTAEVLKTSDVNSSAYLNAILEFERLNGENLRQMNGAVSLMSKADTSRLFNLVLLVVFLIGAAIVLGIFGWLMITRIVVGPVKRVAAVAQAIAEGDLTPEDLNIKSGDEIGMLGASLDRMKRSLNETIGKLQASSENVAASSTQLDSTASEIARGVDTQSSQTNQIATAMEEMNSTVTEVARNSQYAAESANTTKEIAKKGGAVVERAVEGMMKVAETVRNSTATVETLSKRSEEIGDIVAVINDIADQTNLLALNAAIEAARAGEQGRGFAVVADEVRSLAEKTTRATKEIADMIRNIQTETNGAMVSMQEGMRQTEEGMQLASEAGQSLKEIVASVERVADMVNQIATASEEQNVTTEEIASNITGIAGVAKKTASDINYVTGATGDLSKVAAELKGIVEGFRIDKKDLHIAVPLKKYDGNKTSNLKVVGI